MDIQPIKEKIMSLFQKYKYAFLVLLVGIFLMVLPKSNQKTSTNDSEMVTVKESITAEERLEQILTQVDGAGKVRVLLTYDKGEHITYQVNSDTSVNTDTSNHSIDTVLIQDADRKEQGLVAQIDPPTFLGAIILCQGADQPAVKLALTEAVSKVTGLGANQISVLKMK